MLKVIEGGEQKEKEEPTRREDMFSFHFRELLCEPFISLSGDGTKIRVGYQVKAPMELPEPIAAIAAMSEGGIPLAEHVVEDIVIKTNRWWHNLFRISQQKRIEKALLLCKKKIQRAEESMDKEAKLKETLGIS